MGNGQQKFGDSLEGYAEIANTLFKLKLVMENSRDFMNGYSRYLEEEDRLEMARIKGKADKIYWKYWERLLQRIRGI